MSLGIRILLSQYRGMWRLRARLSDLRLRIWNSGFRARRWIGEGADSSAAILSISKLTIVDMIAGVGVAGLLWIVAPYTAFIPPLSSEAAYVQLLAVIAGVGGVFIGLYYTAITAAMTAVYARMPATVRQLLLEERVGNSYMRLVATTTFLALILLALRVVGATTPSVVAPVLAVLSGVGVFGFVKLGTWAFRLFDPTAISPLVFRNLQLSLNQVKADGYRWREPAFQEYSRRGGARGLRTLKDLATVCQNSEHLRDGALASLAAASLAFSELSVAARRKIPTTSRWFPEIYVQPDWYRASDNETSIAHATGTPLRPKSRRDVWWVEKECVEVAMSAMESFLARSKDGMARELMSEFESYLGVLAQHGHLTEAKELVDQLYSAAIPVVLGQPEVDETQCLKRVALVDSVSRLWVVVLLRAADWADSLGTGVPPELSDSSAWLGARTPYRLGLSVHVLPRAESLCERLEYERMVQGASVTPNWYLAELLAQPEAEALSTSLGVIFRDAPQRFSVVVDQLREGHASWPAACCLSEALHYVRKAQAHLHRFKDAGDRLGKNRRIAELPWPADNFQELDEALTSSFVDVVEKMALLLPQLPERPNVLPDFPGQFLHTCVEEVFEFILAGDVAPMSRVIPSVFVGCLAKYDALKPTDLQPDDPRLEASTALSLAPILDLAELSGFSLLLSQVHPERATWPTVQSLWDTFLDGHSPFVSLLTAMLKFSKGPFAIAPRAILRTGWNQRVDDVLRQLPKRAPRRRWYSGKVVDHPSTLVQAIASPGELMGSFYDGCDIFAACYLAERPGFQIDQLHRKAASLREQIARRRATTDDGAETEEGIDG